ncbi:MAG: ATP-binding cassette domain-containing protein [Bacteroidetes bacterium]|nr:ATP-binding cassette domain-containing protein [Bacteroidota bacterium]
MIRQLQFSYIPQEPVLAISEIQILSGSVTAILGGNGTGKTTLLKLIGGILDSDSGRITFPNNETTLYIHQNPYLLKGSVEQNIRLLLKKPLMVNKKTVESGRIGNVLSRMGLDGYEKRQVHKLSGGEKKRAAIVCALLADRDIILMDEPTAHLDEQSILQLEELVNDLRNRGKTVVLATHDQAFAYRLADEVWQLEHGVPVMFDYNYLHGNISRTDEYFSYFSCGGAELKVVPAQGSITTAVIDSKDIIISRHPIDSSAQNTHTGIVIHIEERESTVLLEVDCGFTIRSSITRRSLDTLEIKKGTEVFVIFKTSAVRLY